MEINNYVSLNSTNLITAPYRDGIQNIRTSFSINPDKKIFIPTQTMPAHVRLTLADRVALLFSGIGLIIPVVNIVVFYALKYFATQKSPTETSAPPLSRSTATSAQSSQSNSRLPNTPSNQPAQSSSRSPSTQLPSGGSGMHRRTGHIGAGVLPYAIDNHQVYFLLSEEGFGSAANTWCEFGGGRENGETAAQTAARECWEESKDFLGNQNSIEQSVQNSPGIGDRYNIFLLRVNDWSGITNQQFTARIFPNHNRMEKSRIAWVRADAVFQAAIRNQPIVIEGRAERLRPFFAQTLQGALNNPRQRAVIDQIYQTAGAQLFAA